MKYINTIIEYREQRGKIQVPHGDAVRKGQKRSENR